MRNFQTYSILEGSDEDRQNWEKGTKSGAMGCKTNPATVRWPSPKAICGPTNGQGENASSTAWIRLSNESFVGPLPTMSGWEGQTNKVSQLPDLSCTRAMSCSCPPSSQSFDAGCEADQSSCKRLQCRTSTQDKATGANDSVILMPEPHHTPASPSACKGPTIRAAPCTGNRAAAQFEGQPLQNASP
jgi:hypothetical protein